MRYASFQINKTYMYRLHLLITPITFAIWNSWHMSLNDIEAFWISSHVYVTVCWLCVTVFIISLRWHHNGRDSVSNHQPHHCLLNRLFRRRSKKTSKLRVTGLCVGNSLVIGEFPAQMDSNAENVSIWWRHQVKTIWMAAYALLISYQT